MLKNYISREVLLFTLKIVRKINLKKKVFRSFFNKNISKSMIKEGWLCYRKILDKPHILTLKALCCNISNIFRNHRCLSYHCYLYVFILNFLEKSFVKKSLMFWVILHVSSRFLIIPSRNDSVMYPITHIKIHGDE